MKKIRAIVIGSFVILLLIAIYLLSKYIIFYNLLIAILVLCAIGILVNAYILSDENVLKIYNYISKIISVVKKSQTQKQIDKSVVKEKKLSIDIILEAVNEPSFINHISNDMCYSLNLIIKNFQEYKEIFTKLFEKVEKLPDKKVPHKTAYIEVFDEVEEKFDKIMKKLLDRVSVYKDKGEMIDIKSSIEDLQQIITYLKNLNAIVDKVIYSDKNDFENLSLEVSIETLKLLTYNDYF